MANVCFYFQIHQPFRLRRYRVFDVGASRDYFDERSNREILEKVARKCYLPATRLILDLVRRHGGAFRAAYSVSGTALEQLERHAPEVIGLLHELVSTGCVEILSETSHHSLAALRDAAEFRVQVERHRRAVERLLGAKPVVFRNTELIYDDRIARLARDLGFQAILAEGVERVLGWRSPNYVYRPRGGEPIRLLVRNHRLSDDIGFRFARRDWEGWPLTAEKLAGWIASVPGDCVNLFLDYETFGEHQWADTGIFDFLLHLPGECLRRGVGFQLPREAARLEPRDHLDVDSPTSWADTERDLSAWLGNDMQRAANDRLYALLDPVRESGDVELLETWRRLSTSDHLYYMSTKRFSDGDVHGYFNAYDTPYEAFIAFMNVLTDLEMRVARPTGKSSRAA